MTNKKFLLGILVLVLVFGMTVVGCGGGPTDNSPEAKPYNERWFTWVDETSSATINYSIASDGVVTVTMGGTPDDNNWKANISYQYTAKAGKEYIYKFEAWEEDSGMRIPSLQYYWDDDDRESLIFSIDDFWITGTRKIYTLTGTAMPKGGVRNLEFQCAGYTGKFYIKVISITAVVE
jgi:hypothetical protein